MQSKKQDLIIFGYDMIGESNPWGAPEVELWVGEYKNSSFILGRIYDDPYEEDGETYYNSSRWEFENEPYDENNEAIDETIIVELIDEMEYDSEFSESKWKEALESIR